MGGFEEGVVAVVAILAIFVTPFAAVAWVIVSLVKSRNKERIALLTKGVAPSALQNFPKTPPNKYTTLRNACLFIALAIGLVVGLVVDFQLDYSDMASLLIILSSVTLFIGLGYLVFFLLVRNKNMEEE